MINPADDISPASRETSKSRSSRIPSDYFKKTTQPVRWKLLASGLALLLSIGYAAFSLLVGDHNAFNHGPISRAHAGLRCSDCHGDEISLPISKDAAWASAASIQDTNHRCNACHFAGQQDEFGNKTHHFVVTATSKSERISCIDCHREHQGHDVTLAAVMDTACLHCHQDLASVHKDQKASVANVLGFREHPDFRALEKSDPGQVKFNHALHLQAGIYNPAEDRPEKAWKINRSDAIEQRYQADSAGSIQLRCADCHEPTPDAEFMKPVAYKQHCQLCHPLSINLESDADVVGHGLKRDAVVSQVYSYFALRETNAGSPLLSQRARFARPGSPSSRSSTDRWQSMQEAVRGSAQRAIERLYDDTENVNSCYYCHLAAANELGVALMEPADPRAANKAVPDTWFQRGRFDHNAHGFMECDKCHSETSRGIEAADDHNQVMIPSIEVCRECHRPTIQQTRPFASSADCTKCHDYHSLSNSHGSDR